MKPLMALRGVGPPPSREDTHGTLDRPPAEKGRRKKSGRTEQFNSRVQAGFKERVEDAGGARGGDDRRVPGEAARATTRRAAATLERRRDARRRRRAPAARRSCASGARLSVFQAVPKLAAERGVLVPELIEDLVAREVERLDPHGGKFGVKIAK